jgi:hypothetical protein
LNLPEQKSYKPQKESISGNDLEIHRENGRNGVKDCTITCLMQSGDSRCCQVLYRGEPPGRDLNPPVVLA